MLRCLSSLASHGLSAILQIPTLHHRQNEQQTIFLDIYSLLWVGRWTQKNWIVSCKKREVGRRKSWRISACRPATYHHHSWSHSPTSLPCSVRGVVSSSFYCCQLTVCARFSVLYKNLRKDNASLSGFHASGRQTVTNRFRWSMFSNFGQAYSKSCPYIFFSMLYNTMFRDTTLPNKPDEYFRALHAINVLSPSENRPSFIHWLVLLTNFKSSTHSLYLSSMGSVFEIEYRNERQKWNLIRLICKN